jgi:hypothetical protein
MRKENIKNARKGEKTAVFCLSSDDFLELFFQNNARKVAENQLIK